MSNVIYVVNFLYAPYNKQVQWTLIDILGLPSESPSHFYKKGVMWIIEFRSALLRIELLFHNINSCLCLLLTA